MRLRFFFTFLSPSLAVGATNSCGLSRTKRRWKNKLSSVCVWLNERQHTRITTRAVSWTFSAERLLPLPNVL
ncbi:hypothetical protein BDP27DRAFT_1318823 [Rhodocollybia butyracea]|uniref:Secreted protein n=1 Tax=Rhodocollybia butyracea TaxID=206335 RepID=A0A9P5PK66_9AGAR|nr:hypothetical protein BDP27DRAFT_1344586 [Rhodocollybia butyracea]KAF9067086.1 hypothetical protein BDP27DRAFT_1329495 [Rhodocollybia butyracea]KAF9073394.1 hypothetical protein BDP27DRAFT_1318823 [Rhodocollybia butyracea]